MEILARRLTIITVLMALFAIALTAAVNTDARRHKQMKMGEMTACAGTPACRTTL
ncbi:MAG: hypothetical protein QHC90_16460 [Shinella sp.]|nr:hypothetical protein [Shinella sp.]